ncbi:hypothetical protein AURANDRAFT_66388 [Aureococcus anophagefferens]|uniref:Uncharacterized protein n=1 Tax=Aureococcus anophagefferens TaxID=44056 RepID=F0YHD2_AURAN|nr:hypothetical protein AURANDRAFT_66388 [Aureococcus anophagefferens]EGB05496.1 hypothetical protein AURANDRAFT_66388 [Aureococcus anophagefferens]|eukprot:XP_009039878.1 hypothetical protein AURANDRAFT_66388 [Aureococcus anophagefferens]
MVLGIILSHDVFLVKSTEQASPTQFSLARTSSEGRLGISIESMADESDDEVIFILASASSVSQLKCGALHSEMSVSDNSKLTPGPELPVAEHELAKWERELPEFQHYLLFMRYGLTLCDCEPHLTSTEPRFWAPGGISPRPHSDSMKSWLVHEHVHVDVHQKHALALGKVSVTDHVFSKQRREGAARHIDYFSLSRSTISTPSLRAFATGKSMNETSPCTAAFLDKLYSKKQSLLINCGGFQAYLRKLHTRHHHRAESSVVVHQCSMHQTHQPRNALARNITYVAFWVWLRLYRAACDTQPYASQGWLELSRMEEERGHQTKAALVVRRGLEFCSLSDTLLMRAIKHAEKLDTVDAARALLAPLKHVPIEKVWRAVLEGALLEARCGNTGVSRKVFKFLMERVSWYGPIFFEAYRLEERSGEDSAALDIIDRGLLQIPRYGPIWFGAFRVCERLDAATDADVAVAGGPVRTRLMLDRALHFISKELVWKVHFEAAQMEERAAARLVVQTRNEPDLRRARRRYVQSVAACPMNLRWKVWLAGGLMELSANHLDYAVLGQRWVLMVVLFARALKEAPSKSRFIVCLECARLEEKWTHKISKEQLMHAVDAEAADRLDLRCANADPNYGAMWFECRHGPADTARIILARARSNLVQEICVHQHVYAAAIAHWRHGEDAVPNTHLEANLALNYKDSDFTTGLVERNRLELNKCDSKRRFQILFGSDCILP